jgi:hypothetical protein
MIDVTEITHAQKTTTERWHQSEIDNPYRDFLQIVCQQHQRNYRLWHREDVARSRDVADAELAQVKRDIDQLNQQRNDLIERLDDYLLEQLQLSGVRPWPDAQQNTETPGSAIDRLSILALRIYHMEEQANRADADQQHRAKAKARLEILRQQHGDLSLSLSELLEDIFSGRKHLKVYRQFKMYNDPTMNPCLYQAGTRPAA